MEAHRSDAPLSSSVPPAVCLSGDAWYRQSAFRAMNQAVGRCIRHAADYGAILLLDERMASSGLQGQLSRWMRPRLTVHGNADVALESLEGFFSNKSGGDRKGLRGDGGGGLVRKAGAGRQVGSSGCLESVCAVEPCVEERGCCRLRENGTTNQVVGGKVRIQTECELDPGSQLRAPSEVGCQEGPASRCCQKDEHLRSHTDSIDGGKRHGECEFEPFSKSKAGGEQPEKTVQSTNTMCVDAEGEAFDSRQADNVKAASFVQTQLTPLTPHMYPQPNTAPAATSPSPLCSTSFPPLNEAATPTIDSLSVLGITPQVSQARRWSGSMLRNWEGRALAVRLSKLLQGDDVSTSGSE